MPKLPVDADLEADHYIPMSKTVAEGVDVLVKMAHGSDKFVNLDSEKDWKVIEATVKLWGLFYKEEFKNAIKNTKKHRKVALNKHASSEDSGTHFRHLIDWPVHLAAMIEAIYPQQRIQDKKFILKFLKLFPMFQIPEKL